MDQDAEKLIGVLQKLCEKHGWIIAIGPEDADGNAIGLVVGKPEYVDDVIDGIYADSDNDLDS